MAMTHWNFKCIDTDILPFSRFEYIYGKIIAIYNFNGIFLKQKLLQFSQTQRLKPVLVIVK